MTALAHRARWQPTRENVRLRLRKSYLSLPEARYMSKSPPGVGAKHRIKWVRYALLAAFAFGVYHILTGPSGALNILRLRQDNARLGSELDSLALRKQSLEIEKQRLEKDTAYIERVARKELGMAKPDEKVFRFVVPKDRK